MRNFFSCVIILLLPLLQYGQTIHSGDYAMGLHLAYDSSKHFITGYFENYAGMDKTTGQPMFSCIFYIKGKLENQQAVINTFYPGDKASESIGGTLHIAGDHSITIQLNKEHGGCWNIQQFSNKPATFALDTKQNWIQVRFVTTGKAFFYSKPADSARLKSYAIKNNFICIERISGKWAYAIFLGEQKTTKGWMRLQDLNDLAPTK
ncbi:MAG: hypothetical protein JST86_04855 [Bacteroidetes bacterium]|nr:hypothetical protein [Bacteroidota bacterium]